MGPNTSATLNTKDVAAILERADILLTRGRGFISRLIRWGTKSHWNHVALVYVLSDQASKEHLGYQSTFIIEAEAHGVDIHPIDKYLCNEGQDMMVVRLPDDAVPSDLRLSYLRRVRGFALEQIDAGYDPGTIVRISETIFGPVARFARALVPGLKMVFRTPGVPKAVNRWICSGVAQHAYYRACFGATPGSGPWNPYFGPKEHLARVVFASGVRAAVVGGIDYKTAKEMLKLTTPADIALAAKEGRLRVVAERIKCSWSRSLTRW